jgi:hypothetical protein
MLLEPGPEVLSVRRREGLGRRARVHRRDGAVEDVAEEMGDLGPAARAVRAEERADASVLPNTPGSRSANTPSLASALRMRYSVCLSVRVASASSATEQGPDASKSASFKVRGDRERLRGHRTAHQIPETDIRISVAHGCSPVIAPAASSATASSSLTKRARPVGGSSPKRGGSPSEGYIERGSSSPAARRRSIATRRSSRSAILRGFRPLRSSTRRRRYWAVFG